MRSIFMIIRSSIPHPCQLHTVPFLLKIDHQITQQVTQQFTYSHYLTYLLTILIICSLTYLFGH